MHSIFETSEMLFLRMRMRIDQIEEAVKKSDLVAVISQERERRILALGDISIEKSWRIGRLIRRWRDGRRLSGAHSGYHVRSSRH
jgi:hypothetical protein